MELCQLLVDTAPGDLPELEAGAKGAQKRTRDVAYDREIALPDED